MYTQLYRIYLGDPGLEENPAGDFVTVPCPFHNDTRPSAGFNTRTGVFNCFICGGMSVEGFISRISKTTIDEAARVVEDFRREEGLTEYEDTFVKFRARTPQFNTLCQQAQEGLSRDLPIVQSYMGSRRLEFETLQQLGIGYLPADVTYWGRPSLVFPYICDGECVGLRYRDASGNKSGEPGCHFTLWGIDELDRSDCRVAICVEGESDRLAMQQICNQESDLAECVVVSTPTAQFRREWQREFQHCRRVVMIPHADEASVKMVREGRVALGERLNVLQLPWKRKQVGKDLCDWLFYHEPRELVGLVRGYLRDVDRVILTGEEFGIVASRPRQWVCENLLARREVCVIGGHQKSFKTWAALNLVRACTVPGIDFLGIPGLTTSQPMRVLICEEEGDAESLFARLDLVLTGIQWRESVHVAHQLRIKLDEPDQIELLEQYVREHQIDLLVCDPFQRMYSCDENSASEMGAVWEQIHYLLGLCPWLAVVLLHHFHKSGTIHDLWWAFRGSSRTPSEADVGIFIERKGTGSPPQLRVAFDGRSIRPILDPNGDSIHSLEFDTSTGLIRRPKAVTVGRRKKDSTPS